MIKKSGQIMIALHLCWLLLSGSVLSGCADRSNADRGQALDRVPEWSLQEDLRIGSVQNPDSGFSAIAGMQVDADGHIYVLDRLERQIRVFDSSGRLITRIGRRGDGPGEFQDPRRLVLVGDTLFVAESARSRMTLFTTSGKLIATVPPNQGRVYEPREGHVVRVAPFLLLSDGTVRGAPSPEPIRWQTGDSVFVPILRFSLDGEVVDSSGVEAVTVARSEMATVRVGQLSATLPFPMVSSNLPRIAYLPDGGYIYVESPPAMMTPPPLPSVTKIGPTGEIVWRREYSFDPIPVDEQLVERIALQAGRQLLAQGADSMAVIGSVRAAAMLPEYLKPVDRVAVSSEGNIWLEREVDERNEFTRWTMLTGDGEPMGQILLPRLARIWVAATDYVLAEVPDAFGVPFVVRYRLLQE